MDDVKVSVFYSPTNSSFYRQPRLQLPQKCGGQPLSNGTYLFVNKCHDDLQPMQLRIKIRGYRLPSTAWGLSSSKASARQSNVYDLAMYTSLRTVLSFVKVNLT
ncbi:uncharacterized protein [Asterias amurensis]|uniref:uncharacterized protein isoform X1 n=1 Tax=Asterias amurensis TaxID=7602 RepID=UPI003AB88567